MNRPHLLFCALLLGSGGPVAAQPPAAPPHDAPGLVLVESGPVQPGTARAPVWSADLLLGLPTGVRLQRTLDEDDHGAWFAEGFVGLEFIFPMVGGGARRGLTAVCGGRDALCVNPGLGAYLLINPLSGMDGFFGGGPTLGGLIAADVDLVWRHAFGECSEGHLGLKLGAGFGHGASWGVLPIVSIFLGWRF